MKADYVYILVSRKNGTIYTTVTSDLIKPVWRHKNKIFDGFSKKYDANILVYFEQISGIEQVILREKRIKLGSANRK